MDSSLLKALILSLFALVLELVSAGLDQFGKNKVVIHLVAFLLSAFGCAITLYSIIIDHTTIMAETQLQVLGISIAGIRLIAAFIQYLLTVSQVKKDYNVYGAIVALAFPLAFAMISVVFICIKIRKSTDLSPTLPTTNSPTLPKSKTVPPPGSTLHEESESSTTDARIESTVQTMTSIPTEPDQIGTSTDQVNPARSSIVRPHTDVGKQINTIIFSKRLSKTDINIRYLAMPDSAREHIKIPEGDNQVYLKASDSDGETWTFLCSIRSRDHFKSAVLTKGWPEFVEAKNLGVGDEVTLRTMQEDKAGAAAQYMILVNRAIK